MYHAYLVALYWKLQGLTLTLERIGEKAVTARVSGKTIELPLPESITQSRRLALALERLTVSAELLEEDCTTNADEAVAWLLLEDLISDRITGSWIEGGEAVAIVAGQQKRWQIEEAPPYRLLYGAKLIRDGYNIREEPGKGFVVVSPAGEAEEATPFSCTCQTLSRETECRHMKLAQLYLDNRKLCQLPSINR